MLSGRVKKAPKKQRMVVKVKPFFKNKYIEAITRSVNSEVSKPLTFQFMNEGLNARALKAKNFKGHNNFVELK